jgi:hypothetical protein
MKMDKQRQQNDLATDAKSNVAVVQASFASLQISAQISTHLRMVNILRNVQ